MAQSNAVSVLWDDDSCTFPSYHNSSFVSSLTEMCLHHGSRVNINLFLINPDSSRMNSARKLTDKYDIAISVTNNKYRHSIKLSKNIVDITNTRDAVLVIATNNHAFSRQLARARINGNKIILLCDKHCESTEFMENKLWTTYRIDDGILKRYNEYLLSIHNEKPLSSYHIENGILKRHPVRSISPKRRKSRSPIRKQRNRSRSRSPIRKQRNRLRSHSPARYTPVVDTPKQIRHRSPCKTSYDNPVVKPTKNLNTEINSEDKKELKKFPNKLSIFCPAFVEQGECVLGKKCKKLHKCKRCLRLSIGTKCEMECRLINLCPQSYFCSFSSRCPLEHTEMEKRWFAFHQDRPVIRWKVDDCQYKNCFFSDDECRDSHGIYQYFCIFCTAMAGHYEAECPNFAIMTPTPLSQLASY